MDIFAACDKKHGVQFRDSGEASSVILFVLLLFWKILISPIHRSNLKEVSVQEIWPGYKNPVILSNNKFLSLQCDGTEMEGGNKIVTANHPRAVKDESIGVKKTRK